MSYQRRRTEFEIEQQIFLGGQVSDKYKEFQEMARLSPDYAEIYMFFKLMPELEKLDPEEGIKKLILYMGEIDFIRSCNELTKLSMILGDTRGRYSAKGLKDELARASQENP